MASNDYREGSVIEYSDFLNARRTVTVEVKEVDIKNGRPGFVGTLVGSSNRHDQLGSGVWGYDSQIIQVAKY